MRPRISLFLLLILVLATVTAGCVRTGHHTTVDETKFPDGAIISREEDKGVGLGHHAYVVHIYPAGTNGSALETEFFEGILAGGWTISGRGNVTEGVTYFDAQKSYDFLSCEVGRVIPLSSNETGVGFLCRFGGQPFTYRPTPSA